MSTLLWRQKKSAALALTFALLIVLVAGLLRAGGDTAFEHEGTRSQPQTGSSQNDNASQSDKPGQTSTNPAQSAERSVPAPTNSVLKVYRCPVGQARAVAARLAEEFGENPSVRVVPDGRTSQLLIMAPPAIHAQIAGRLLGTQTAGATPSSTPPGRPLPASPVTIPFGTTGAREVQLWNVTGEEFELALVRTLGDRLSPITGPEPDASAYRLALANGQVLRVSVNRRSNRVKVEGSGTALQSSLQLVHALDRPEQPAQRSTSLISLRAARSADVQRAVEAIGTGQNTPSGLPPRPESRVAMVFQEPGEAAPGPAGTPAAPGKAAPGPGPAGAEAAEPGGLIGPVQIEVLEGLDMLVIRGHERDVEQVRQLIEQIEELTKEIEPSIEVVPVRHVDCRTLAALLNQLYEDVFALRQGAVSITALVKPNALLLIGRTESVATVLDLVKRLDRPVPPSTQFRVFRLKNAPAETAVVTITGAFPEAEDEEERGLGPRVQVIADFRTNSLIVRASPSDMAEVEALIERIDASEHEAFNEVRVFKLKNSLAEDLAPVLQDAITGQMYGQRTGQRAVMQRAVGMAEDFEHKSVRLQFVTVDAEGRRVLNSGILTDVQVTADARANALIVTASADSMPLIEALIEELDQLPTAEAQVKVFTIYYGDATSLMEMLEDLFGTQAQAAEPAVRTGAVEGDSSLVSLRFATDVRTNSVIATGAAGDLELVEAILTRLDESDIRRRETIVIRLKNATAENIATAVTEFLTGALEAEHPEEGLLSAIEQLDREVVVVQEPITNSLIISATEKYFEEVKALVEELDRRPPMVVIQVLIAAVALDDTCEFGVELGLQDSILFNRSDGGVPGFLFNNQSLGNNTAAPGSNIVGAQGLSHFTVDRINSQLGYGGLVLSASSEAVSILIRALKEDRRIDVLGRPQIMTMDNVRAMIQVGQQVPFVTSISPPTGQVSQTFNTTLTDVGIMLSVLPKISPEGQVMMQITATRSEVGPEEEGIPVSVAADGTLLRQPRIEIVQADTTVSAMDGHTVVLGGLIEKRKAVIERKVPWLADIPVLGRLFRFDSESVSKDELLIILTPHVVESDEDAERIKEIESARIDWCLQDVIEIHDGEGLRSRSGPCDDAETPVIYPDLDPTATGMPTLAPGRETPDAASSESPFRLRPTRSEASRQESTQPAGDVQPAAYELAQPYQVSTTSTAESLTGLGAAMPHEAPAESIVTRDTRFSIPFQIDRADQAGHDPVEVQLYVSTDRGASWRLWDRVPPEQGRFAFEAFGEGEYRFQMRTVYAGGRVRPERSDGAALRVIVDTTVPVLQLLPRQTGPRQASVQWSVRDPHPELNSLTIEYRVAGTGLWNALPIDWQNVSTSGPAWTGDVTWPLDPAAASRLVEIRAYVTDAAGNSTVSYATADLRR